MATLNTLRTKFGIVLSLVIALALLAFIFSLGADMGFSGGNDPQIGEIDGKAVNYSQYIETYENIRNSSGVSEINQQVADNLAQATWDNIFNSMVLVPGFDKLGLAMSEEERLAVINGSIPTQALYSYFADPSTGQYNVAAVSSFLSQASSNSEAAQAWADLLESVSGERATAKYVSLIRSGVYTTALEVAQGLETVNNTYAGRWVGKRYSDIDDAEYAVSDKEISDFYNKNKEYRYKQDPSKSVQYVEFAIAPTADDEISIEREMNQIAEAFKASENPRLFVRENSRGSITQAYISADQLRTEEAEVLLADEFYGPVKNNNVWSVAKAVDVITAPDSIAVRQLVLSVAQSDLADSLLAVYNGRRGADFAAAVAQYSISTQSAQNGGDLGVMPLAAYPVEFVSALSSARVGSVVKIANNDYIQLLQVYQLAKSSKHMIVASIEYPVEASKATTDALYSDASSFAVMAKGSLANFKSAADSLSVVPRFFSVTEADRVVRNIDDSNSIATWANNAKVGEISQIFKAGSGYVVAVVVSETTDKYRSLKQVESIIRNELIRDKKYQTFANGFSATSIEQAAEAMDSEVSEFENIKFSSYYVQGLGVEPRVIGSIAATSAEGVLSAPIQGNSGIYLFVVDNIDASGSQTAEGQKVFIDSYEQDLIEQTAYLTLKNLANIKDQRGKFF